MAANRNGPCLSVTPVQSLSTEEGWRQLKEACRAEMIFFYRSRRGGQKLLPSFLASRPY